MNEERHQTNTSDKKENRIKMLSVSATPSDNQEHDQFDSLTLNIF